MSKLYQVLDRAFTQVMRRVERDGVPHRTAAMAIGVEKVRSAKTRAGCSRKEPTSAGFVRPSRHPRHG